MTSNGYFQLIAFFVIVTLLVKPFGSFMARVYEGERTFLDPVMGPVERFIYRLCGVDPKNEMTWRVYAFALIAFSAACFLAVYGILRIQGLLPANPMGFAATTPDMAFNVSVSFLTNTNWQDYGGESTVSYLTQMLALTVQNFVSAAAGMAILVALIRGMVRKETDKIGNFWVDLTRTTLYILLPLSFVLALFLVSQGVVQTFAASVNADLIQPLKDATGQAVPQQVIAVGPAASQIAIKQLGTNGGGFFNANSAHPFENPTALSGLVEMLLILLIPAALCYTFGRMVKDTRQGWALYAAMLILLVGFVGVATWAEQSGNPMFARVGADDAGSVYQPGGNMEGKEARFGIVNSAIWDTSATATSNGSVNSMIDSFTPIGGFMPMMLIKLGEVVFGGVGCGLYGMIIFAAVAVFIGGLMVGRTPEYLGKKIESFEVKMASITILVPPFLILLGTSVALMTTAGKAGIFNPGPHGFSEVLYGFDSAANNNGSAFGGLGCNSVFYNTMLGMAILFGRFWPAIAVLAIAGSLAKKKSVPIGAGTIHTHTPLFVGLLIAVVVIMGCLTFIPSVALGPIVEHLMMVVK